MPPLTPAPIPSAPSNLGGAGGTKPPRRDIGGGDLRAQLGRMLGNNESNFGSGGGMPTPAVGTPTPAPTSGPGWMAGDTTTSAPGVGTWYSGLGQMQQPPPNQANPESGGGGFGSLMNLALLSNPQTAWMPLMGIDLFGSGGGQSEGGLLGGLLDPFFGGTGTGGGMFGDLFGGLFGGQGSDSGMGSLLNLGLLSNPDTAWIPLVGGLGGDGGGLGGMFDQLFSIFDNDNGGMFGGLLGNLGGLLG